MKTVEIINSRPVSIDWQFEEIIDRHDSNWCEWLVIGIDENSNKYTGNCQADGSHPEDLHDDVKDIEMGKIAYSSLLSFENDFNEMFP